MDTLVENTQTKVWNSVLTQTHWLTGLLCLALAGRLYVGCRYEINWDEFYYLSLIYDHLRGDLSYGLQTFHVHLFSWVTWLPENEAEQIIALRLLMLLLQLLTCLLIFRICRRFSSLNGALFSVLAYAALSYNMRMGNSFRVDPLLSCCLMATLDVVLQKKTTKALWALAGLAMALAMMLSIKSALYLPTIGLILLITLLRPKHDRLGQHHWPPLITAAVMGFALMYLYHYASLGSITGLSDVSLLSHSLDKTLEQNTLFPRKRYLSYSFIVDMGFWLTLLYGLKIALNKAIDKSQKQEAWLLLALLLPLTSLLFYRNAFPYYYAFILAPVSPLCGIAWDGLEQHSGKAETNAIKGLVLLSFSGSILFNGFWMPYARNLDNQQQLLALVHRLFPEPSTYIDRCGMVSSFQQVGFFMSTWGMENYHLRQSPLLTKAISSYKPAFFIANLDSLDISRARSAGPAAYQLLAEDKQSLSDNYIHHWGELYVAGKEFVLTPPAGEQNFTIIINGGYTLEGHGKVLIDGEEFMPGDLVQLNAGQHSISAMTIAGKFSLRWGEQLYRPEKDPEERSIFNGF
ncbi:glycosyltransferase family 39 protein [Shewanella cyperi]|uniref:glycosyltransferase family 39 protein n=1 Tax=Shewanella cyperi TaxID=2814292 RepID=UPI001A949C8A|nr:glycosyltransferase family 39 protein [Shewanella cyperi]QSX40437.1 glycosyltransferase family 39 protein [Shewanella cyperi]